MHLIGNAHIDPVWLWRWQNGFHEVMATFRAALDRLEEYEGFVFTCAGARYYSWVEENEPEMFDEIRRYVDEGRWVIVGGMWIQPDLNMPSGESLARQLLISQHWFREHMGTHAVTGYNVDSFGQSAMLPQILRNAGMTGYVWMRPNSIENPDVPEGAFLWKSQDGSAIPAFRIPDKNGGYTCSSGITEKLGMIAELEVRTGLPAMCFYGVGNHGGGPTIELLNTIEEEKKTRDDLRYSSPDAYFAELAPMREKLPVWDGEMQHHASGCYSTYSRGKRKHRMAENALLRAEISGVSALLAAGRAPRDEKLREAWKDVLFTEFHDVMCGCCIRRGLEDGLDMLSRAEITAEEETAAALHKISWRIDTMRGNGLAVRSKQDGILWGRDGVGTPVVLFNPHPYTVTADARFCSRPGGIRSAVDFEGNHLPVQTVRAERTNGEDRFDAIARVNVPPMGWRAFYAHFTGEADRFENALTVGEHVLSNGRLRAEFDGETGGLRSLTLNGKEYLAAPARIVFVDIGHCDTWAHGVFRFDRVIGTAGNARYAVEESGPVRAALRVESEWQGNRVTQIWRLYADSDVLEAETVTDLVTPHVLCKLEYTAAGEELREIAEVPGGVIRRTACGNEEPCQRYMAVCGRDGGLGFINDGRYSYSCEGNTVRLTAANTSLFADHYGQSLRDGTCEPMDTGRLEFRMAVVPFAGSAEESCLRKEADLLNRGCVCIEETYHKGPFEGCGSMAEIASGTVALECLKTAEDGRGLILRLRECAGREQETAVRIGGDSARLTIGPWQIRTWRIDGGAFIPVNGVEENPEL